MLETRSDSLRNYVKNFQKKSDSRSYGKERNKENVQKLNEIEPEEVPEGETSNMICTIRIGLGTEQRQRGRETYERITRTTV